MIRPDSSAHWYKFPTGEPCHEILGKNGKMRSPNINEAVELGLVPSVTTIKSVIANPGLEAWKQNQLVYSALTHPNSMGLDAEKFARIVIDEATEEGKRAARRGTNAHAAIAEYWKQHKALVPNLPRRFPDFASDNGMKAIYTERSFANESFGGQIDFIGTFQGKLSIVDFKTSKVRPEGIRFWPDWQLQLAAYLFGYGSLRQIEQMVSIVIPLADDPEADDPEIEYHIWDQPEAAYGIFLNALSIWQWKNKWHERQQVLAVDRLKKRSA